MLNKNLIPRKKSIHTIIIGLGSNIQPDIYIPRAQELVNSNYSVVKWSSLHRTKAVDVPYPQPDFINCGCLLETDLSRAALTKHLKLLEVNLGRKKKEASAPRCIDMDILMEGNLFVDKDIHHRKFLRDIILELRPELNSILSESA